ncbi:MAG: hypothetical protein II008_09225 [Oscillospiraceae bacterium]|nr:hypothetical protein [Oscillospiraceae bacterium]
MKIEIELVKKILEEAETESLKPVNDSMLLADYGDKMYNFGVEHMFHVMLMKLYDAQDVAKGVSA